MKGKVVNRDFNMRMEMKIGKMETDYLANFAVLKAEPKFKKKLENVTTTGTLSVSTREKRRGAI